MPDLPIQSAACPERDDRLSKVEDRSLQLMLKIEKLTSSFEGMARELKQLVETHDKDIHSHEREIMGGGEDHGLRGRILLIEQHIKTNRRFMTAIGAGLIALTVEVIRSLLVGK